MRVAVSSEGRTLESRVDPRFGRCAFFVIVDPVTMDFEAVENASVAATQGAGIATAQTIVGKGVEAVLTGNCGPNAYQALSAAGVKVISGVSGLVREAARAYSSGQLQASAQANVASHFGMAMNTGRGMGGGMARSSASASSVEKPDPAGAGMTELLVELKGQLDALREQVSDINRRIDKLHQDD